MKDKITAIVFSKNRPMQLYALLESMFLNTDLPQECVNVLFKADHEYIWPMEQVKEAFPRVNFHPEYSFRQQTMDLVQGAASKVVFFTDDDVFKDKMSFKDPIEILDRNYEIYCFSLRLGKHLTYCYSTQSPQSVPQGITKDPYFCWVWRGADWDWNYPLSVDGHIFKKDQLLEVMKGAGDWKSPNTFEGNMSHLHPQIKFHSMMSYTTSKVFNIPHNRVQSEVGNVFGGGSENDLLDQWNKGMKIDIKSFQGIKNISAHQLVDLKLTTR